jgi:hypothetical protein
LFVGVMAYDSVQSRSDEYDSFPLGGDHVGGGLVMRAQASNTNLSTRPPFTPGSTSSRSRKTNSGSPSPAGGRSRTQTAAGTAPPVKEGLFKRWQRAIGRGKNNTEHKTKTEGHELPRGFTSSMIEHTKRPF